MKMPGNNEYTVVFSDHVTAKDIPALPQAMKNTLKRVVESRLQTNPADYGKPMRHSLKGYRRIRVGDYRIVYRVDQKTRMVYVVAIGHRRDIYQRFGH